METFDYRADIERDGDLYLVTFPDVPEAAGSGTTQADALEDARGGLGLALLGRIEAGEPLPEQRFAGSVIVRPPAFVQWKLAVHIAWTVSGWTKSRLGETLGVTETEARRILDPMHNTRLATLERALTVLGGEARLSFQVTAAE